MGKRKENENLAGELASSFAQWEYLKEHGGSDPFYADGTNMNLVRNHIMYYKNRMVEEYGRDYEKYPEIFYREVPPEVNENYMARAGEIKDGAAQALEYAGILYFRSELFLSPCKQGHADRERGKADMPS